ncbi:MAG TPA: LysE family translocator [Crocinitomicaceae bacterium]|nr:LysE family translocator [Crocinitomicaceae bacterium]
MEFIIFKGILTGLLLSLMLGPSFFLLIETSIKKGIRAALCFDAGVLLSDLIYIMIAYLFYQEVSSLLSGSHIFILKIIGGLVFAILGFLTMKKKSRLTTDDAEKIESFNVEDNREYFHLFAKGFLWNFANPMIIIYWLTVITVGIQKMDDVYMIDPIIVYLSVILSTFFAIDIFKVFAAKKLRPFITPNLLQNLSRFVSFILIGFGVIFFIQGVVHFVKL